jgi:hypothetical protein
MPGPPAPSFRHSDNQVSQDNQFPWRRLQVLVNRSSTSPLLSIIFPAYTPSQFLPKPPPSFHLYPPSIFLLRCRPPSHLPREAASKNMITKSHTSHQLSSTSTALYQKQHDCPARTDAPWRLNCALRLRGPASEQRRRRLSVPFVVGNSSDRGWCSSWREVERPGVRRKFRTMRRCCPL